MIKLTSLNSKMAFIMCMVCGEYFKTLVGKMFRRYWKEAKRLPL